jgi:[acyl-carrier-protein] S-malonyltransferase
VLVIVCPGQGAQTPGFFAPWLELPEFRSQIELMQNASGIDLIKHGTESDADTIRDTAIAQPLIVSASIASAAALLGGRSSATAGIAGVAGHSVGEIAAASIAGVFDPTTAIKFVQKRGNEMALAAAIEPTSMAAIVGGDQETIEAALRELDLEPANYNGGGQIVAAGSAAAIEALKANAPAGSRVIPLQVAGAFHTRYMKPAVASLGAYAETIEVSDPATTLWTNAGGRVISSGQEYLNLLVNQVSSPVRWDLCMAAMLEAGVTAMIEVSPAGTLVGLAKRSMPDIETLALKTPENLDAAQQLIANHAG